MYERRCCASRPGSSGQPGGVVADPLVDLADGGLEAGDDAGHGSALGDAAGVLDADHPEVGRDHRRVGEVELLGVGGAAVGLDPAGQRLLGRPPTPIASWRSLRSTA